MARKRKESTQEVMNEPVVLKMNNDGRKSKYDNDEVYSFVVENRNKEKTWEQISEGLQARGYEEVNPSKVSEIHARAIAKSVLIHNTATEKFTDFSKELDEMNSKRIKILNVLLDHVQRLNDELANCEDNELLIRTTRHIRMYPQIMSALSETRQTIDSYMSQQDKVLEEKNAMIWSEGQVLESINEKFPELLREFIKTKRVKVNMDGSIKIVDPLLK